MAGAARGPIITPLDIESANVTKVLEPGARFQFTFNLGDAWMHRCEIAAEKIDPVEVLGDRPDTALPYWGWGTIRDQRSRSRRRGSVVHVEVFQIGQCENFHPRKTSTPTQAPTRSTRSNCEAGNRLGSGAVTPRL